MLISNRLYHKKMKTKDNEECKIMQVALIIDVTIIRQFYMEIDFFLLTDRNSS